MCGWVGIWEVSRHCGAVAHPQPRPMRCLHTRTLPQALTFGAGHTCGNKPERVPNLMKNNVAAKLLKYPISDSTKFCLKGQLLASPPPRPPPPVGG